MSSKFLPYNPMWQTAAGAVKASDMSMYQPNIHKEFT